LSAGKETILAVLVNWTPYILKGFAINVFISIVSMALATILGVLVGVGQVSTNRAVRSVCWAFTNFFRNAPWLVVLFYCMLLLPFQFRIGGVQSIPTGQWESAESLAFTRRQTLFLVILPQCIKRLLPPWMNLYALVMVSTPLCAIVGVNEIMTVAADILASNTRHDLLIPVYFYILLLFFFYCYPIARVTQRLERRFAVIG
jgi:polar amino acid transport system permease protein